MAYLSRLLAKCGSVLLAMAPWANPMEARRCPVSLLLSSSAASSSELPRLVDLQKPNLSAANVSSVFAGGDGELLEGLVEERRRSGRADLSTEKTSSGSLYTPRTEGEILSASNLKSFTLKDMKIITRNFGSECCIGEVGFGYVYKGWMDDQTLAPSKPGRGMVVAVKKLKLESFQGHKEWLVCVFIYLISSALS
nr:PREDICTED: probable receptor-like protein kinase At3g55450 [Musa acuminata subsp. malaccensis]